MDVAGLPERAGGVEDRENRGQTRPVSDGLSHMCFRRPHPFIGSRQTVPPSPPPSRRPVGSCHIIIIGDLSDPDLAAISHAAVPNARGSYSTPHWPKPILPSLPHICYVPSPFCFHICPPYWYVIPHVSPTTLVLSLEHAGNAPELFQLWITQHLVSVPLAVVPASRCRAVRPLWQNHELHAVCAPAPYGNYTLLRCTEPNTLTTCSGFAFNARTRVPELS